MNGGQTEVYGVPIRVGDVIKSTTALVDMNERVGKLGLTLFKYTDTIWTNQNDEFVKKRTSITIVY